MLLPAGLTASQCEEEVALGPQGTTALFKTLDHHAATIPQEIPPQGLSALAAALASGCSSWDHPQGQLQLARVCYSWVVGNVLLPERVGEADTGAWEVGGRLFEDEEWEEVRRGDQRMCRAERGGGRRRAWVMMGSVRGVA